MTNKLSELGLIDGDLIKVEKGTPHEEETYELHATLVTLVVGTSVEDISVNDELMFTKVPLCSFRVAP